MSDLPLEGGLRDRLISDSFARMVKDALTALGWFQPSDAHEPIVFRTEPLAIGTEVPLNTCVVLGEDIRSSDAEIGSTLTEDTHSQYVDFYGQNRSISQHFIGDVRDICKGQMPSIGRDEPHLEVRNWHEGGDLVLFGCEIEDVQMETAHGGSKPHERNWVAVSVDLVEERP